MKEKTFELKKFEVDISICNACGACALLTDLLVENDEGKAVPVAGCIIKEPFMPKALEIVAQCPVKAIKLSNLSDAGLTKNQTLKDLPKSLECAFSEFVFPEVTLADIKLNAEDYPVDLPGTSGAYDYTYSSYSKAEKAGLEMFDRLYFSQYRKFILNIFVQYKNDKLKPFYTFDRSKNSHYFLLNKQIETMLQDVEAKAKALSESKIKLPADFSTFDVYPDDKLHFIRDRLKAYLGEFEKLSTQSGVMAEMENRGYRTLSWYATYIDTDDRDEITYGSGGRFSRDKTTTKYCYKTLYEAGRVFIDNLQLCMDYVDIDEHAIGDVQAGVENHKENALKKMEEKLELLRNAIKNL